MRIFKDTDQLPEFRNGVLTIGTFDGVHIGHQKIINRINQIAGKLGGESILLTFHPHPRFIINPQDTSLKLLNTIDEKLELLEQYGINNIVINKFSKEFSQISPEEYIRDFLFNRFHPKVIVIGYDHHFGKDRKGNIGLMREMGKELGFEVEEITKQDVEDITVSSTRIRKALEAGDIKMANALLGHPFSLQGTVVTGDSIGRTLGFPTANIHVPEPYKLIPAIGVYAVKVYVDGSRYNGMLSIGKRPTFNGKSITIEVNIFEFDEVIYGKNLKLELIEALRPEYKYDTADELIHQMHLDKENALKVLS